MDFLKTMVGAALASLLIFSSLAVVTPKAAWAQSTIVQVMSVNNPDSAAAEVQRLMAQGVPSFQRAEQIAGMGTRYRVYLGPFDSPQEATGAAEALKSSGLIKEYIVRSEGTAAAAPVQPAAPQAAPIAQAPPQSQEYWPPLDQGGQAPQAQVPQAQVPQAPATQEYWPPLPQEAQTAPPSQEYWPPPPGQPQAPSSAPVSAAPAVPVVVGGAAAPGEPPVLPSGPVMISQGPGEPVLAPSAQGALQGQPPVLPPTPGQVTPSPQSAGPSPGPSPALGQPTVVPPPGQLPPGAPGSVPPAPGEPGFGPPPPSANTGVIPAKPIGPMKIQGFEILSDLSSSMRRISACPGGLIKQEAVNTLLRRMNHRIPSQPYLSALRVFGYKQAWTRSDYTTLYFGPAKYDRGAMEEAIGRLFAADSISPFGFALSSSENELAVMNNPKAILMFADFEVTTDPGAPVDKAKAIRRKYGDETKIYTFYITRQTAAERLAKDIAKAGGGKDYSVCELLNSGDSFEAMMTEIFGPADLPPCADTDRDGVCDQADVCPSTPAGAPVDERGCWIAAYSQFFDFDKAEVKSAFHPRLKFAAELIVKNPAMGQVIIAGHTDGKGTDAYNMDLGRKRAEAVKELLVKFGAPADRLVVESFGKSRPIATNDTEEGRAKNRRVEFHVGDVPK